MKNKKSMITWILIIAGIIVAAYAAFKLYHYGVNYAAQRIRGEVSEGVGEGVGKGIGGGFGLFPFTNKS
jgi:hypothetical protein